MGPPPRGGGGSDDSALGGETSGCPSQLLWRHHSAPKVGAPNNAPRSQKTARASGEHPGVLKEPEAATVGYVAARAPLLAVSSLRGADGVDDTAVRTLLKLALLKKKEEEKEEKKRK